MPPKATAKVYGKVIAESDQYTRVEGNIYFPPGTINRECLRLSETQTFCPWKGHASYYDIEIDGELIKDAAWFYPDPMDKFKPFKDYVAFYKTKVHVIDSIPE